MKYWRLIGTCNLKMIPYRNVERDRERQSDSNIVHNLLEDAHTMQFVFTNGNYFSTFLLLHGFLKNIGRQLYWHALFPNWVYLSAGKYGADFCGKFC